MKKTKWESLKVRQATERCGKVIQRKIGLYSGLERGSIKFSGKGKRKPIQ